LPVPIWVRRPHHVSDTARQAGYNQNCLENRRLRKMDPNMGQKLTNTQSRFSLALPAVLMRVCVIRPEKPWTHRTGRGEKNQRAEGFRLAGKSSTAFSAATADRPTRHAEKRTELHTTNEYFARKAGFTYSLLFLKAGISDGFLRGLQGPKVQIRPRHRGLSPGKTSGNSTATATRSEDGNL